MQTSPISITRESKDAELDQSIPKLILLGLFGVGLSVLLTKLFLDLLSSFTTAAFLLWFAAVVGFLIIAGLEILFVKSAGKLFFLMLLQGIAPLAFFIPELYPHPVLPLIVGDALFVLLLALASHRAWNVLQKSLSIQFSLAVRSMLPKVVTGILLFLSVVTYVQYAAMGKFSETTAHALFDETLAGAEPIVKLWFPDVSFTQSTDAFFESVARTQLERTPLSALGQAASDQTVNFKSLSPSLQAKLLQDTTKKLHTMFVARYGPIPEGATLGDTLFVVAKGYAENAAASMGNMLWVIVSVAVFFILRGFFTLVLWLVSFITFLVYKFLIITGFAYVAVEIRNREFILLS